MQSCRSSAHKLKPQIQSQLSQDSRRSCLYRAFHDYFISHLPSNSLHPDSRASFGPGHQLPRSASRPHEQRNGGPEPAPLLGHHAHHRDTTVVRIPLRSAKHHFGVSVSRGSRPYNEDTYQAGVIDLPAFAKRRPASLSAHRAPRGSPLERYRQQQQLLKSESRTEEVSQGKGQHVRSVEGEAAESSNNSGVIEQDPQVFYFGVFDGHGGTTCSGYLRELLHGTIEKTARLYQMQSSLQSSTDSHSRSSSQQVPAESNDRDVDSLIQVVLKKYRESIGGYFRRFKPEAFYDRAHPLQGTDSNAIMSSRIEKTPESPPIDQILTHAFLALDLQFLLEQSRLSQAADAMGDRPINHDDCILRDTEGTKTDASSQGQRQTQPFYGGSTASIALISTPSPTPFWHPSTISSLVVAHVGDTRIILCRVNDGEAIALTSNHHPSTPSEATRLRRWATSFVTDSFGEERLSGLANTRAFGDMTSKRMGVSAEPEIRRIELKASEYAFMVMVSDGVSGVVSDQEIVDVVKESLTPELAARELVSFATDVGGDDEDGADNAAALVVRLGGWERRQEGGGGSLRTQEERQWKRRDATEGRRGMT